jgi:hypothetical protein
VLTRFKLAAALGVAALGLLAFAAPAQAAEPAAKPAPVKVTAQDAASLFTVVRKDVGRPVSPAAKQVADICRAVSPEWTVIYNPTGDIVFSQRTFLDFCYDGVNVTRLRSPVDIIVPPRVGVTFGVPTFRIFGTLPGPYYRADSIQPFTYCPASGPCLSATHVVAVDGRPDGQSFSLGFFQ